MKKSNHKLCRICGKADAQLIPIFHGDGLVYNLPSKIEKHLFSILVSIILMIVTFYLSPDDYIFFFVVGYRKR